MAWSEEEDEHEFEWKEEDEEEIPGQSTTLSRINRLATVIFLALLALGLLYVVIRLASALGQL